MSSNLPFTAVEWPRPVHAGSVASVDGLNDSGTVLDQPMSGLPGTGVRGVAAHATRPEIVVRLRHTVAARYGMAARRVADAPAPVAAVRPITRKQTTKAVGRPVDTQRVRPSALERSP